MRFAVCVRCASLWVAADAGPVLPPGPHPVDLSGQSAALRFASRAALLLRAWFLDVSTRMNANLDYG